jgi:hypothetical protein
MSNLVKQSKGRYYLKPDTEITEEQYNAITAATERVSGDTGTIDIERLHAEQDPASPLYKGSESLNIGSSELATGESKSASAFYESTATEIETVSKGQPEPQGTTAFTAEEVNKPAEFVQKEEEHTITQEDLDANHSDLQDAGVKVGDPVTLGEPVKEDGTLVQATTDAGNA